MHKFKTLPIRLLREAIGVSKRLAAIPLRRLLDLGDPVKAFRGQGRAGAVQRLIAQRRRDAKNGK